MHTIYPPQPFWNTKREFRLLFVLMLPFFFVFPWGSNLPAEVSSVTFVGGIFTWMFLQFVRYVLRQLR